MTAVNLAGIAVALIAAISAYASQRAAARASVLNTSVSTRMEMEKEAYERARNFDTDTIRRQAAELEALRKDNINLHREVMVLRTRLERIELSLPLKLQELLIERLNEPDADPD